MTLALDYVYDALIAKFAAASIPVSWGFGWETLHSHITENRVVLVPGDASMNVGQSRTTPMSTSPDGVVGHLNQLGSLYITGYSGPAQLADERLMWRATVDLRNLVFEALTNICQNMLGLGPEVYVRDSTRTANVTVRLVFSVIDDVLATDLTNRTEPVSATGEVSLTELDVTEVFDVPSGS